MPAVLGDRRRATEHLRRFAERCHSAGNADLSRRGALLDQGETLDQLLADLALGALREGADRRPDRDGGRVLERVVGIKRDELS